MKAVRVPAENVPPLVTPGPDMAATTRPLAPQRSRHALIKRRPATLSQAAFVIYLADPIGFPSEVFMLLSLKRLESSSFNIHGKQIKFCGTPKTQNGSGAKLGSKFCGALKT